MFGRLGRYVQRLLNGIETSANSRYTDRVVNGLRKVPLLADIADNSFYVGKLPKVPGKVWRGVETGSDMLVDELYKIPGFGVFTDKVGDGVYNGVWGTVGALKRIPRIPGYTWNGIEAVANSNVMDRIVNGLRKVPLLADLADNGLYLDRVPRIPGYVWRGVEAVANSRYADSVINGMRRKVPGLAKVADEGLYLSKIPQIPSNAWRMVEAGANSRYVDRTVDGLRKLPWFARFVDSIGNSIYNGINRLGLGKRREIPAQAPSR